MDLSIVIPAYEESNKIGRDIIAAAEFLMDQKLEGEIIVVDDGSKDSTSEIARKTPIPSGVKLKVIRYEKHHGKGFAVRTGMQASKGKYAMFADSGLCTPYHFTLCGLNLIQSEQCEIAHGSRKLPESKIVVPQPLKRRISARLFRLIIVYLMKVNSQLTDTQCGFKIYLGDVARSLYGEAFIDGFMFDIEIIVRAKKEGFRIKEFPIEWKADPDSRLSLPKIPLELIRELWIIHNMLQK